MTQLKDVVAQSRTDRRQDVRYICHLQGAIETEQGGVPCEITSLSSGGLSARCFGKLTTGDLVDVRCFKQPDSPSKPLRFQVQWASKAGPDQMVRLSAHESPEVLASGWMTAELEELKSRAQATRQRRGGVRVGCQIPATLSGGEESHQVVLRDLGTTGAKVECSKGQPDLGGPLLLTLKTSESEPAISVEVAVAGPRDADSDRLFGVVFGEFQAGNAKDIVALMNKIFSAARNH